MKTFDWAVDKAKFEAACLECGINATEEQIKAAYVKRAGLVRGMGQYDWKKGVEVKTPKTEKVETPILVNSKGKK